MLTRWEYTCTMDLVPALTMKTFRLKILCSQLTRRFAPIWITPKLRKFPWFRVVLDEGKHNIQQGAIPAEFLYYYRPSYTKSLNEMLSSGCESQGWEAVVSDWNTGPKRVRWSLLPVAVLTISTFPDLTERTEIYSRAAWETRRKRVAESPVDNGSDYLRRGRQQTGNRQRYEKMIQVDLSDDERQRHI